MSSNYDVVIVQDVTASQWPYLNATRYQIHNIISTLRKKIQRSDEIRFRLIVFRDHPPMDPGPFIIWRHSFTSNANTFMSNVAEHSPKGNIDGPEAQMDGLREALYSKWAPNSSRTVILITDSAPHAMRSQSRLGEGFPNQCPCGTDPKWLMNQYIRHGVTLHVIGCEPTLSGEYQHGREYYTAFATKTNGIFLPMNRFLEGKSMKKIRDAIVGMVLYTADNNRLAMKLGDKIHEQAAHGESKIAHGLHRELVKEGVKHYGVVSTNIYPKDSQVGNNIWAWQNAKSTGEVWKITYTTSRSQRIYDYAWTNNARGLNITLKRDTISHTHVLQIVRIALAKKRKAVKKAPAKKSDTKPAKKAKPSKKAAHKTKRIVTSRLVQDGTPTESQLDDEEGDSEESQVDDSEDDSEPGEDHVMMRALVSDEAIDGKFEHKEEGTEDPNDPGALGGVDSDDPSEDEDYDDTDVEDFENELFPRIRLVIPEESKEQTGEIAPPDAKRDGDSEGPAKKEGDPPKSKPGTQTSVTAQALRLMGGKP